MTQKTCFRGYWQGGFECSTHVLRNGRRLDLVAATRHDIYAEEDYQRLSNVGIVTVREGLRWHVIRDHSGRLDFGSAIRMIHAARRSGVQIIWDLLHFGWPEDLDIFSSRWLDEFTRFAEQWAGVLKRESADESPLVAPVNEISFMSWAGGDVAYLNPFETGRGAELKRQLVRGAICASKALLAEIPRVRLVAPEPVIHIVGDATCPEDMRSAEAYRLSMFEAWDMLAGRLEPELGGAEKYLDVLGLNYYDRNQRWNYGPAIHRHDPAYRPFREIIKEVFDRYHRTLFISETGTENDDRPGWFAYIATEARAAANLGVPVHGVCLYPILNHPGWDDGRHCRNGLWDYAGPAAARDIYQPLADELIRQREIEENNYGNPAVLSGSPRSDLSLAPALELCISAPATSDEPIRAGEASLFH